LNGSEVNEFVSEVRLKKGESVDKALRRLKKKLDREGTLREARQRRNYEKPSVRKRRKAKEPKLNYWGTFSL
jgi:small subunit ribosomal protein S21